MSKLDVDKHIDVEIRLDELDLTSAESKATYAQIKEYILEKFDLKVSTLYIAQIKKKCGIELREHYNKSKKEKQVIPQCTPEKEESKWKPYQWSYQYHNKRLYYQLSGFAGYRHDWKAGPSYIDCDVFNCT